MIAQRFRSVGWVAGVAAAACILYLISLQVASERGRLEDLDRKIAMTKRDIRQLQTELNTRGSLRQLERWNGDVLALSAPVAGQYLESEAALARIDGSSLGKAPIAPAPVMMAASTLAPKAETALSETDRSVQQALNAQAKPARVALLDRAALLDLSTAATSEKAKRTAPRP